MKLTTHVVMATLFIFSTCIVHAQRSWCTLDRALFNSNYIISECQDTLVNDTLMRKLARYEYNSFLDTLTFNRNIGHLYEENNRMFIKFSTTIKLIYDFNLNTGDSFEIFYPGPNALLQFVVSETDSIQLLGKQRKRIFLNNISSFGGDDIWVSGIGSITTGFLNPGLAVPIGNYSSELLCFQENLQGNVYLVDTLANTCYLDLLIDDCNGISSILNNQINSMLNVKINVNDNRIELWANRLLKSVKIFNLSGNVVSSSNINSNEYYSSEFLPAGIYIIEVVDVANNNVRKKIAWTNR